jgi:hypothetical protein
VNPAGHGLVTIIDVALLSLVLGVAACALYFVWRGRLDRALRFVVALFGSTLAALALHAALAGVPAARRHSAALPSVIVPTQSPEDAQVAYPDVVEADAPVAFYRLNERSGTSAIDSSAHTDDGTYAATVQLGRRPLLKGDATATSASFPGGYVIESATWEAPAVTAECWLSPTQTDIDGSSRIIDNAWTDHDGNGFMVWISHKAAAFNTGWLSVVGPAPLHAGRIYHIVGTYDGATGASLYINGTLVAHAIPGPLPKPQEGDDSATYIGVLNTGTEYGHTAYFRGNIADCAVYDHALTPERVAAHYNAGSGNHVVPQPLVTLAPKPLGTH